MTDSLCKLLGGFRKEEIDWQVIAISLPGKKKKLERVARLCVPAVIWDNQDS